MDDTALEALYAELPALNCRQLCGAWCGPIKVGPTEWPRMVAAFGSEPSARSLVVSMRCPFLASGHSCSVYPVRPLICRLWGMVEGVMACPHGCTPSRWLTADEAWALLAKVGVDRPTSEAPHGHAG